MTLFVKPLCSLCGRAKRALDRGRFKYKEVSVHTADGLARHSMELCGGSDGSKLPMLKIGEECIYKVVSWVKAQKESV